MKNVFFYLPDYPEAPTGGIKYHNNVYEYFRTSRKNVRVFGNSKSASAIDKSKLLKFISGLYYSFKIPSSSVIFLSNTAFLHFLVPQIINKVLRRHRYFMVVHHLIRNENPEFFRRTFEKLFIKNADSVVTISKATLEDMLKHGITLNDKMEIVPPGLDKVCHDEIHRKKRPESFNLLFTGTIEQRKGLHVLMEALSKLPDLDFKMTIAGDTGTDESYYGMLKERLHQSGLDGRIFFAGRVSTEELIGLYKNSDIFVFPSLWEGYGMVVPEAMSAGVPSVSSELPSLKGILIDGENGLYFKTGDADDLAKKLRMLMEDEILLKRLSYGAFERSKSLNTWDDTSSKLLEIVESIE